MHVVVLAEDGFEDSELTGPVAAWQRQGWRITLAGREAGQRVTGKRGAEVTTDMAVQDVDMGSFDVLCIPGGYAPDKMRLNTAFVDIARRSSEEDKLMAVICHGPQLLIEAGIVEGRRMTAWPSVWTDLRNAGAEVVDQEVVVDGNLVTSRKPSDVSAFSKAVIAEAEKRSPVTVQN